MDIFDLSAKISLDSSGFENGVNKASGSMDGLSAKAVALGNAIYDIGSKAVSAFGTLAKSALEGYANFEQLVGGVDTLFKDSSDKVQEYASNAFQTAGMSANEYMETVTGFSAALIRSVGGDTERAAELANMAITDMADNANKMGTSLESLQNAYTGFSRGNFTMLDNLALGFAGTKEGMQELLDTANELNARQGIITDYQIQNYSDIVEAIHVVQTEMGITGTTAAEASETISGSVASMKAAWENWLAGLGNADADMSGLTDNLISSVETVWSNISPVLDQIKTNLADVFVGVFEDFTGIDLTPVIEKFNSFKDGLSETISSLTSAFQEGRIGGVIDELLQKFEDLTGIDLSPFIEKIQNIKTTLSGVFDSLKSSFDEGGPSGLFSQIGESLNGVFTQIVDNLPTFIQNIASGLANGRTAIMQAGINLFTAIAEALPQIAETIAAELPGIVESWANNLSSYVELIITAGLQLFSGLSEAILQVLPILIESLAGLVQQIGDAIILNASIILAAGVQLFSALLGDIPTIITTLGPSITMLLTNIVDYILGLASMLVDTGVKLFSALLDNLPAILEAIFAVLPDLVTSIASKLLEFIPYLVEAGIELFSSIISNIPGILAEIVIGIIKLVDGIVTEIISHKDAIIQAGYNLLLGLAEGISSAVSSVIESVKGAVSKVVDTVMALFDEHSPSRVFMQIGEYAMEGLAIGFEDGSDKFSKRIGASIENLIPSDMTGSIDFASSSLGKSSSAQINTMLTGMQERGGNYNINLVVDGRTLANVVFDPLNAVSKQKGVALGA